MPELARTIVEGLDAVYSALPGLDVAPHGQNIVVYKGNLAPGPAEVEVGVQVARPFARTGDVEPSLLPAGEAARTVHTGPYSEMHEAWDRVAAFIAAQGRRRTGLSWEVYGDMVDDQSKLETEIYVQLQPG